MESEYMESLLDAAIEQNLTDDQIRNLVLMEVGGKDYSIYGVEFIANQVGVTSSTEDMVEAYITELTENESVYRPDITLLDKEYGDKAYEILDAYTGEF